LHEPGDVLRDPQLAARGFWQLVERDGRTRQTPGPFVHVQLAAAHGGVSTPPRRAPGANALDGVNVLDLSWALVGSLTTKALGDHGACVIKLESARRPCLSRLDVQVSRSSGASLDDKPWFAQLNTSKLGLQLDLKHPRAREVLEPLIAWADVVVENFSPGTLDKLGLGYAVLSQRKPELIMISASAYGQTGPLRESWGVDGTSAALSSRMLLTGWPDRGPVLPGALPYADVVVPQVMVASLVAALVQRLRTGRGCYIDASMYEVSVQQMARALEAEQSCDAAAVQRRGNRDPDVWHQGVYPARGVDRWIAISLFSRADYALLCQRFGESWPAPQDVEQGAARAALDARLAECTRERAAHALMLELQGLGIAAGVVQDIEELVERDPQLRSRPAWVTLDHARLGPFEHQCMPYHLERSVAVPTPAPGLGEHTEHVCRDVLGLSAEHIAALRAAGLFT
jgi:crotonobetainyl-CoA:carnitine CoA-transferase CaiB-like acyl-CoA transferase